jgi:hypothetical protein
MPRAHRQIRYARMASGATDVINRTGKAPRAGHARRSLAHLPAVRDQARSC